MKKTLILIVLAASVSWLPAAEPSSGSATNTAVIPTPRADPQGHETFIQRAAKGNVDIVFFGDSITARWLTAGKEIWKERFAGLHAVSFGVGGDRTEHLLWRIQNGELQGIHPKVAVVLIGTNNLKSNSVPEIVEGITAVITEIRTRSPETKILLLGILPRGKSPDGKQRAEIKDINNKIAGLQDGRQIFFLDIGGRFLQPDGSISEETMPDFLHLTAVGYVTFADAIREKLEALLKSEMP